MLLETGEVGLGREVGGGERRGGAGGYREREGWMRGAQSNADGSSMLRGVSRTATLLPGSWWMLAVLLPRGVVELGLRRVEC